MPNTENFEKFLKANPDIEWIGTKGSEIILIKKKTVQTKEKYDG